MRCGQDRKSPCRVESWGGAADAQEEGTVGLREGHRARMAAARAGAPACALSQVCARLSLLWQLAPLRRQQAAESSPLLWGKMLSLKRPSGASAFYCNQPHRLPFGNLLVCARGERAGESGAPPGEGRGDSRRMLIRGASRAEGRAGAARPQAPPP